MRRERGDIYLLSIFWLWLMLIFFAAVWVLGQAFVARRAAQNAADAAALAAAYEGTVVLQGANKPRQNCGIECPYIHYCFPIPPQQCVQSQAGFLNQSGNLAALEARAERYAQANYGSRVTSIQVHPDRAGLNVSIKVAVEKQFLPQAPQFLHLPGFGIPAQSEAVITY